MRWVLNEHFRNLYPELLNQYKQAEEHFRSEIIKVSEQFQIQLQQLLSKTNNPEEEVDLQERIKKAARYFLDKNEQILQNLIDKTIVETDNKEVKKRANNVLGLFQTELRQKQRTLEACLTQFTVPNYLLVRAKASLEEEAPKPKKKEKAVTTSPPKVTVSNDILHPELYEMLRAWRSELARKQNLPAYVILSQMALIGITNLLPQDAAQLLRIPGVGKTTLERYGEVILGMVAKGVGEYGYSV
jgi:superfamily II DNA helicase RecQ